MTSYKEYKLEDTIRRKAKQSLCVHCEKVILYTSCGSCGKPIRKILQGEEIDKPVYVREILCACVGD